MVVNLDHAATTPMVPEVRARLLELLAIEGNPAAAHGLGRAAKAVLERARNEAAGALGVSAREVVFTGTATEALLIGVGGLELPPGAVVATAATEHPAVREALRGIEIALIGLEPDGRVSLADARRVFRGARGRLAALVLAGASSETGVIQPVARLAAMARDVSPGTVVVSDLVALAPFGLDDEGPVRAVLGAADVAVISPHKLGGPTGIGVLVVREGVRLAPVLRGGGQERGLRGGTQAVWLAGAAARSLALAREAGATRRVAILARRRELEAAIRRELPDVAIAGEGAPRVGTSLVAVPGATSEELVVLLDAEGICASAGAACSAGAPEPSGQLLQMGWEEARARSVVRLSVAPTTTGEEVREAARALATVAARLRAR
jgi:cysteine desulfurase